MGWASRGVNPSKNSFSLSPLQVAPPPPSLGGSFHHWGTRIEISPDLPDVNLQNTADQRSDSNDCSSKREKTQPVICNSAS